MTIRIHFGKRKHTLKRIIDKYRMKYSNSHIWIWIFKTGSIILGSVVTGQGTSISSICKRNQLRKDLYRIKLWQNTQYLSFEIRIFYICQNSNIMVPLGYKFPKDSMDTKFAKFGCIDQKIWILEDHGIFCPKPKIDD